MTTNKLKKVFYVVGSLLASGLATYAGPLRRSDVAAAASWVLHLDCDGLRPTAVGKYILGQLDQSEAADKLAAFQTIFGFDPRKQLHGLTLYGSGTNGVLLVDADFDADQLTTLAKAATDYQSTDYKGHVVGSWIDDKDKKKHGTPPRTYGVIRGKQVIFGKQESNITQALDVLDGRVPNLASSSSFSQLGAKEDANILEGAARDLQLSDPGPQAAILRMARLITLQVKETQPQLSATLSLEAKDASTASEVSAMAGGLLAFVKLQQDNAVAAKIAKVLQIHQDGAIITASLTLPDDEVVDAIKADAAHKAAKKEKETEAAEDSK